MQNKTSNIYKTWNILKNICFDFILQKQTEGGVLHFYIIELELM